MTQQSNSIAPRSVSFSHFSELVYIPKDHADKKWYSSQDRQSFRQAFVEDVRRVTREIEEAGGPRNQYDLVGLEVFVKEDLARKVQDTRRAHVRSVLSEQMLQRQRGICNNEKLSIVSMKSNWLEKRARIVAMGFWLQESFEK